MAIQTILIFPIAILFGACGDSGGNKDGEKVISSIAANSESAMPVTKGDVSRIESLETEIQLPDGADSLGSYDRYYIVSADEFRATYIRTSDGNGTVYVVSSRQEIPDLMDGGCQVINVSGNFSAPANASLFCNGVA